ncbi:MAG: DUF4446 family protein [Clostridiaceae bacterium]|nr:DUF4446 family protein [Clostridiaceae bacterium]
MQIVIDIIKLLNNYNIYILIINTLLVIILFFIYISINRKLKKISSKYNDILNCTEDRNISDLLINNFELTNKIIVKNKELENRLNYCERNLKQCVQKVGIVRYKAFDDVGSDLSFAVAILDANDSGVVINGVYARDSCSTFAKGISEGKSKYVLSAEELQALDIAKKQNR